MTRYVIDTNVLIDNPSICNQLDGEIIIPFVTLQELDKLKTKIYGAREALRQIEKCENIIIDNTYEVETNDDKILDTAVMNNAMLLTSDYGLMDKAKRIGCAYQNASKDDCLSYTGVKELFVDTYKNKDNEVLSKIYSNDVDFLNMKNNEYLVLWDLNKPTYNDIGRIKGYESIDQFKFYENSLLKLSYSKLDNRFIGKISPRNVKQRLAFDMLQNKDTTLKGIFGGFGVGKDFLMVSHAIDMIVKNKIDKIVWVRNNVEVKDTNPIGFLPSSLESKLLPFAAPLADHLGGLDGLTSLIDEKKIEIQHLGFMRGRDIKNSIIYVTECENNTKEHMQLLISRVGEGSQLWVNGDLKQVDNNKFLANNGVKSLKKLAGQNLYGQVTLDKVERSATARLSDLLDD